MIDEIKLHETLTKVLKLSFEERNSLYFKIKSVIESSTPDEAARAILSKVVEMLETSSESIEEQLIGGENGVKIVGGVFRRAQS